MVCCNQAIDLSDDGAQSATPDTPDVKVRGVSVDLGQFHRVLISEGAVDVLSEVAKTVHDRRRWRVANLDADVGQSVLPNVEAEPRAAACRRESARANTKDFPVLKRPRSRTASKCHD